jgi:hypothetical protein
MSSNEELTAAVKEASGERDGHAVLKCSDAFKIAEEHAAAAGTIGKICNEIGVKVVQCQLGCFQ